VFILGSVVLEMAWPDETNYNLATDPYASQQVVALFFPVVELKAYADQWQPWW
jgi:hypothetical protein